MVLEVEDDEDDGVAAVEDDGVVLEIEVDGAAVEVEVEEVRVEAATEELCTLDVLALVSMHMENERRCIHTDRTRA